MVIPMILAIELAVAMAGWILHAAWLALPTRWDGDADEQDALALIAPIETADRTATRARPRP